MEGEKMKKAFKPTFAAPKAKTLGVKPKPSDSASENKKQQQFKSHAVSSVKDKDGKNQSMPKKSSKDLDKTKQNMQKNMLGTGNDGDHNKNSDHHESKKRRLGPVPTKPKEPKKKMPVRSLTDDEYAAIFAAVLERYPPRSSLEMPEDTEERDPSCPLHGSSQEYPTIKQEKPDTPLKDEFKENLTELNKITCSTEEKYQIGELRLKQEPGEDDHVDSHEIAGSDVHDEEDCDVKDETMENEEEGITGSVVKADMSEEDSDEDMLEEKDRQPDQERGQEDGMCNGGKVHQGGNNELKKTTMRNTAINSKPSSVYRQPAQKPKPKKPAAAKLGNPVTQGGFCHKKKTVSRDDKERKMKREGRGESKKKWMTEREIELHGTWVQCSMKHCLKWRYLPALHDPATLPDIWDCSLNPDPDANHCDAPEADWDENQHRQDFIFTKYAEGSLVWAKMAGYPWWPGMIEVDPDYETYYECRYQPMAASHYHVVFLDDNVSRAWLSTTYIRPFTGRESPTAFGSTTIKGKNYAKLIKVATVKALTANSMTLEERLRKYSFSRRFNGKWGRTNKGNGSEQETHRRKPVKRTKKQKGDVKVDDEDELVDLSDLVDADMDALLENASDLIGDAEDALSDLMGLDVEPAKEAEDQGVPPQKKRKKDQLIEVESSVNATERESKIVEQSTLPPKKRKNKAISADAADGMPLKTRSGDDESAAPSKKKTKGLSDSKKTPHDESIEKVRKSKQEKGKRTPKKKKKSNKHAGEVEKVKKHLFQTPSNTPEKPEDDICGQTKAPGTSGSKKTLKKEKKVLLAVDEEGHPVDCERDQCKDSCVEQLAGPADHETDRKGGGKDKNGTCPESEIGSGELPHEEEIEQNTHIDDDKKLKSPSKPKKAGFKKPKAVKVEESGRNIDNDTTKTTSPKRNTDESGLCDKNRESSSDVENPSCDLTEKEIVKDTVESAVVGVALGDEVIVTNNKDNENLVISNKPSQEESSLQDLGPELDLDVDIKPAGEDDSPGFDADDGVLEDLAEAVVVGQSADDARASEEVQSQNSMDDLNLEVEKTTKEGVKDTEAAHEGDDSDFDFEE